MKLMDENLKTFQDRTPRRSASVQLTMSDNDGKRISVMFPYDEKVIASLKTIPGHRWHPKEKQWSVPWSRENAQGILKIFDSKKIHIDPELQARLHPGEKNNEHPQLDQKVIDDFTELRRMMRLKIIRTRQ